MGDPGTPHRRKPLWQDRPFERHAKRGFTDGDVGYVNIVTESTVYRSIIS